jgi:hypothetical protein
MASLGSEMTLFAGYCLIGDRRIRGGEILKVCYFAKREISLDFKVDKVLDL